MSGDISPNLLGPRRRRLHEGCLFRSTFYPRYGGGTAASGQRVRRRGVVARAVLRQRRRSGCRGDAPRARTWWRAPLLPARPLRADEVRPGAARSRRLASRAGLFTRDRESRKPPGEEGVALLRLRRRRTPRARDVLPGGAQGGAVCAPARCARLRRRRPSAHEPRPFRTLRKRAHRVSDGAAPGRPRSSPAGSPSAP